MTGIVCKTLSDSPMTSPRKRRLAALAARPDSEIDVSDIRLLIEKFRESAVRKPLYRLPGYVRAETAAKRGSIVMVRGLAPRSIAAVRCEPLLCKLAFRE